MDSQHIYQRLAAHYLGAMKAGSLAVGERMPSVRALMRLHDVSLSTALQTCRHLERDGWLEARPRSGYFVKQPRRAAIAQVEDPNFSIPPDPAQYVGIHARVSDFVSLSRLHPAKTNLAGARGEPELYPADALKIIALRALRLNPSLLVKPASSSGNTKFRSVLAKRALANGMILTPDDVIVTHGCIEALNLALRAVANPGDTIAVESPTFYGLLQVLESLGMRALEIPTSVQKGISIDALEAAMHTCDNVKAVVVVPNLQNPLGCIMPDSHKQRLVQLCEQNGIALIEDDTYGEMVNSDTPVTALKSWDKTGNVIYCASLHKILAPGMRLGWMVAGRWQGRVAMLKYAQSRDNEEWSQITAAEYIGSPAYDRHLRRLRSLIRSQRERTADAVAAYFPPGTRLTVPNGGVTLWVELPQKLSSKTVFDAALREGILIAPGLMFSNSNRFDHFIRLSCGAPYSEAGDRALRRLGGIIKKLLPA